MPSARTRTLRGALAGAIAAGVVAVVVLAVLWLALPLGLRRRVGPPAAEPTPGR